MRKAGRDRFFFQTDEQAFMLPDDPPEHRVDKSARLAREFDGFIHRGVVGHAHVENLVKPETQQVAHRRLHRAVS